MNVTDVSNTMNDSWSSSIQLRFVKFSFLLVFAIPSTFCAIYIIYSSIRYPSIRRYFYYELLVFLCFLVLLKLIFNISISLSYYARGYILPKTPSLCRFWQYADYASTGCIVWSNAIFTIERFILVFYPHYLRTKRQKIILHYSPIIVSNLHIIIFYLYSIIILTCKTGRGYHRHLCGRACIESKPALSTFDWLFNILFPVFIVIFGSFILLIRVLLTRRKMQRNLRNWSKNWKMIIQLLGIATVYTLAWLPVSTVSLIHMFTGDKRFNRLVEDYLYHLTYFADISVPIIAFIFSPEINRHLRNRVQPTVSSIVSRTTMQS